MQLCVRSPSLRTALIYKRETHRVCALHGPNAIVSLVLARIVAGEAESSVPGREKVEGQCAVMAATL